MPALADIQSAVRDALVRGDRSALAPILSGGAHPEHRLAIHQRHYAASLTRDEQGGLAEFWQFI